MFDERLKFVRKLRKLTQLQLAKLSGLTSTSIAHYECGSKNPTSNSLCKLADALDVTTDYLLGRSFTKDQQFSNIEKLSAYDKNIIRDFIKILADKNNPTLSDAPDSLR